MNFVTAVDYPFCLNLPRAFSQPGKFVIGDPCTFNFPFEHSPVNARDGVAELALVVVLDRLRVDVVHHVVQDVLPPHVICKEIYQNMELMTMEYFDTLTDSRFLHPTAPPTVFTPQDLFQRLPPFSLQCRDR